MNERLGKLRNIDRGHHTGKDICLFKCVLEHDGVHYRCEHTDIVGCGTIHIACRFRNAAENIASADNDRDLDAEIVHCLYLCGKGCSDLSVNAVILPAHEGFAGEFKENSVVFWRHKTKV